MVDEHVVDELIVVNWIALCQLDTADRKKLSRLSLLE